MVPLPQCFPGFKNLHMIQCSKIIPLYWNSFSPDTIVHHSSSPTPILQIHNQSHNATATVLTAPLFFMLVAATPADVPVLLVPVLILPLLSINLVMVTYLSLDHGEFRTHGFYLQGRQSCQRNQTLAYQVQIWF